MKTSHLSCRAQKFDLAAPIRYNRLTKFVESYQIYAICITSKSLINNIVKLAFPDQKTFSSQCHLYKIIVPGLILLTLVSDVKIVYFVDQNAVRLSASVIKTESQKPSKKLRMV